MTREYFPLAAYEHQGRAFEFIRPRAYYALLMEQGTGKTPVLINDTARRWDSGEVDRVLALAPSGVHENWTLREIPKHMPRWVEPRVATWFASPRKAEREALETIAEPETARESAPLRVLAMNWEALTTENGLEMAERFLRLARRGTMIIGDESQRIKSPKALRTRRLMTRLRPLTNVRAIASGTAILNSPWDAYSQFGFLSERILNSPSYTVFKAEYAELLPSGHGLLRHIAQRTRGRATPQIVARDPVTGRPRWRNLDKLAALIAPHSFRVLKRDCLDLPEKVYTQRFFRMTAKQSAQYKLLREELLLKLDQDTLFPVERIASLTKLSQVVSGYFISPGERDPERAVRIMQPEDNPKLQALVDEVQDCLEAGEQVIVWARFHVEIADIVDALRKAEIESVSYHGDVSRANRTVSIDKFERGEVKVFVGQQASGGTGITLVAPNSLARSMSVIYFSNTWSLEDRLQSEDRAHRIGQEKTVRYVDLLAAGTIDERIVAALAAKTDLAQTVLGDRRHARQLLS